MNETIGNYVLSHQMNGYDVYRTDRKENDNSRWFFPSRKDAIEWIAQHNLEENAMGDDYECKQ